MNNQFMNGIFPDNAFNQRSMAYNMYNSYPQQMQQQTNINTNIQRIQGGPVSVNAMQLPPNSIYVYFDADNENPYFYIKSVDANGRPSLKTFIYFDVDEYQNQQQQNVKLEDTDSNYVTKEQFDEAIEKINNQMAENLKKLNDFKSRVFNKESK